MEIEKIQMPKEKAKAEWKKYNELIKTRHDKYLEEAEEHLNKAKEILKEDDKKCK